MKKIAFMIAAVAALGLGLVGCRASRPNTDAAKGAKVCAVVVGMENSRFAGACPGAGYDADRMYKLLVKYSTSICLFRDGNATKANVVSALNRAVEEAEDGLVILFYSGHGGSEPFFDTGEEETDGKDEFLCLWDTYLRDNEIWQIIQKCHGRFFMISDSCHSQTQFRNPIFKLTVPLSWDHELDEHREFSVLCWSGCPDNTYSYGASSGGQFTNALLRHFDSAKSYEEVWCGIKDDRMLRRYENPQSTAIGDGFNGKEIFR